MVMSKPPGERGNPSFFKPRQLKESDYTKVLKWLNQNDFPSVSKQLVIDCVQELCEENIISPVRHYLESLAFDPQIDEPQLSFWMERYLGVEPTTDEERRYVEAVSRLSLIQAVARALNPGCKADSVPILEGGQGIGKSTAIRILHGAEWFGDALPPMSHKDASDYIRGKWGIELAELAFQQKAEVETQKSFISRREERFRPAYGREEICYPRRCVFWEQPTAQTTSKMTQVIVASYLLRPHRSMSKDSGPIETSSGQRLYFTIVMVSNTGCLAS